MTDRIIDMILPTIQHTQMLGYWLAFVVALLETTVGIGLILPGSTLILFLGALSRRGYFDFEDLLWFEVLSWGIMSIIIWERSMVTGGLRTEPGF